MTQVHNISFEGKTYKVPDSLFNNIIKEELEGVVYRNYVRKLDSDQNVLAENKSARLQEAKIAAKLVSLRAYKNQINKTYDLNETKNMSKWGRIHEGWWESLKDATKKFVALTGRAIGGIPAIFFTSVIKGWKDGVKYGLSAGQTQSYTRQFITTTANSSAQQATKELEQTLIRDGVPAAEAPAAAQALAVEVAKAEKQTASQSSTAPVGGMPRQEREPYKVALRDSLKVLFDKLRELQKNNPKFTPVVRDIAGFLAKGKFINTPDIATLAINEDKTNPSGTFNEPTESELKKISLTNLLNASLKKHKISDTEAKPLFDIITNWKKEYGFRGTFGSTVSTQAPSAQAAATAGGVSLSDDQMADLMAAIQDAQPAAAASVPAAGKEAAPAEQPPAAGDFKISIKQTARFGKLKGELETFGKNLTSEKQQAIQKIMTEIDSYIKVGDAGRTRSQTLSEAAEDKQRNLSDLIFAHMNVFTPDEKQELYKIITDALAQYVKGGNKFSENLKKLIGSENGAEPQVQPAKVPDTSKSGGNNTFTPDPGEVGTLGPTGILPDNDTIEIVDTLAADTVQKEIEEVIANANFVKKEEVAKVLAALFGADSNFFKDEQNNVNLLLKASVEKENNEEFSGPSERAILNLQSRINDSYRSKGIKTGIPKIADLPAQDIRQLAASIAEINSKLKQGKLEESLNRKTNRPMFVVRNGVFKYVH